MGESFFSSQLVYMQKVLSALKQMSWNGLESSCVYNKIQSVLVENSGSDFGLFFSRVNVGRCKPEF